MCCSNSPQRTSCRHLRGAPCRPHWSSCHPHNSPHLHSTPLLCATPSPATSQLRPALLLTSHISHHNRNSNFALNFNPSRDATGSPPRRTSATRPSPCAPGSLAVS
ncbi:hypothetical protein M758_12G069500 [Ceratodon purpureus]|nr:hypothetical protein M758_12G069500 [Ceratodon purpureus]